MKFEARTFTFLIPVFYILWSFCCNFCAEMQTSHFPYFCLLLPQSILFLITEKEEEEEKQQNKNKHEFIMHQHIIKKRGQFSMAFIVLFDYLKKVKRILNHSYFTFIISISHIVLSRFNKI